MGYFAHFEVTACVLLLADVSKDLSVLCSYWYRVCLICGQLADGSVAQLRRCLLDIKRDDVVKLLDGLSAVTGSTKL